MNSNRFNMQSPVTKELLFSYFEGRATAFQKKLVDEWARQENNQEFFYECLIEWEWQNPQYVVDVSSAIERHRERMAKSNHPTEKEGSVPKPEDTQEEVRMRSGLNKRDAARRSAARRNYW